MTSTKSCSMNDPLDLSNFVRRMAKTILPGDPRNRGDFVEARLTPEEEREFIRAKRLAPVGAKVVIPTSAFHGETHILPIAVTKRAEVPRVKARVIKYRNGRPVTDD